MSRPPILRIDSWCTCGRYTWWDPGDHLATCHGCYGIYVIRRQGA